MLTESNTRIRQRIQKNGLDGLPGARSRTETPFEIVAIIEPNQGQDLERGRERELHKIRTTYFPHNREEWRKTMLNMPRKLLGPVLGLIIFGLTPSWGRAQDITATITGFVRDSSGAAVAGATVVATNN